MIIHVKNKNTLIIDEFYFKCAVGKNGLKLNKAEGDFTTPKGLFKLKKLYFRKDRVSTPKCNIEKKIITRNLAWCDDPTHPKYNQEILSFNKQNKENLFREDHKYDLLITISKIFQIKEVLFLFT